MKKRNIVALASALVLVAGLAFGAINVFNSYPNGGTAGEQIHPSGARLNLRETDLTHIDSSAGSDGFVNKGDVVIWGDIGVVGVALGDTAATGDLVSVATEGVFHLSLLAESQADVAPGDKVFVITATGDLSTTTTGSVQFGYYIGRDTLSSSSTSVAPILVRGP